MFEQIYYNQLIGTIIGGVLGVLAIAAVGVIFVMRYKLKIEQIKADAMVKAEELRAKNQLEIEKLIMQDQKESSVEKVHTNQNTAYDATLLERSVKERDRI